VYFSGFSDLCFALKRQGNNPGFFGEVFSVKVGNRVGNKKSGVRMIHLTALIICG
jgi:hypothetical protein